MDQQSDDTTRARLERLAALVVIFLASQWLAFRLTIQPENISIFWPPAGVMLAAFLRSPRAEWKLVALLFLAATGLANLAVGRGALLNAGLALNDVAVGLAGAWIYVALAEPANPLESRRNLCVLILVAAVSAIASATIGAALIRAAFGAPYLAVWRLWAPSMLLGILLAAPPLLATRRATILPDLRRTWIETAVVAALVGATAAMLFASRPISEAAGGALIYLPLPILAWIALRRPVFATAIAVFIVSVVAIASAVDGEMFGDARLTELNWRSLHLQTDIAILCLTLLFLAVTTFERKALEQNDRAHVLALAQSEARFRSLVELCPDAILVIDDGHVVYANQASVTLHGATGMDELVGRSALELVHPDSRALVAERGARIATQKSVAPLEDVRLLRLDGAAVDVEAAAAPIAWHGKWAMQVIMRDVTAKKAAERDLLERDRLIQTILDTATAAIVSASEHGVILAANTGAERIFGYSIGELIGSNVGLLMPPELGARHDGDIARYLRSGQANILGTTRTVTARRKDGSMFPAELSVGETTMHGQRIFTGFIRDISARHEATRRIQALQAELGQVARRTAMGEFASVLAHELNQPLAALTNYATAAQEMTQASDGGGPALPATIEKITQQVARAREVVRRMRRLVERREPECAPEDLHSLIAEAVELGLMGRDRPPIALNYQPPRDLPPVMVDRIQIQQVLINLVRNAADAMRDSKHRLLSIDAERVDAREVVVNVRDSGHGIPPAIAERLFEPFVSKSDGGMGLGLSISRSIVEAHGGRLWFEPIDGGGTVFRFTLPLAEAAAR